MPIRAITFDFWGTLYDEVGDTSDRRESLRCQHAMTFFGILGVAPEFDTMRQGMVDLAEHAMTLWRRDQRTMNRRELGERLAQQLGYQLDERSAEALGDALAMAGARIPPLLRVGVNGMLERLRDRYKLGIVSDTGLTLGHALREVLRADQIFDYFDHLTFSDETGTTKPHTRQFLYTCFMLGTQPEETVHIGDLEETDILGAREAGLRTVLLTNGRPHPQTAADAAIHSLDEFLDLLDDWEDAA